MNRKLMATLIAIPVIASLLEFWSPKTPGGVDVNPIQSFVLNGDVKDVDGIKKLLPAGTTYRNERGVELLLFKNPAGRETENVYRRMQISRFGDRQAAINEYQSNRRVFTGDGWKLFDEQSDSENDYFSAYNGPWINRNHGMPIGVVHTPEIIIAFRKKNLLIVVSYHAYRHVWNYAADMNEDIGYVADVLRRSLRE